VSYVSEGSGTDDWEVGGYQACSPCRTITLPYSPRPENSNTSSPPVLPETYTAHRGSKDPMVDHILTAPLFEPNCEVRSFPSNQVGCLQLRLGNNLSRSENRGQMDILRGESTQHSYSLFEQDGQSNEISVLLSSLGDLGVVFEASHSAYLAGKDNIIADWESCHHDTSDWQLLLSVSEAICSLLGPFTINLFASRTNA